MGKVYVVAAVVMRVAFSLRVRFWKGRKGKGLG